MKETMDSRQKMMDFHQRCLLATLGKELEIFAFSSRLNTNCRCQGIGGHGKSPRFPCLSGGGYVDLNRADALSEIDINQNIA
jgi:hypothetical protein